MAKIDLLLVCLPLMGLLFSTVTLSLAIVQLVKNQANIPIWDDTNKVFIGWEQIRLPWQYRFVTGVSFWTMLFCTVLLTMPSVLARRAPNSQRLVTISTLVLNATTMVLWPMALGFVSLLDYYKSVAGLQNATKSFAALLLVVFFVLTVLSVLTASGKLLSNRFGYNNLRYACPAYEVDDSPAKHEQLPAYEEGSIVIEEKKGVIVIENKKPVAKI